MAFEIGLAPTGMLRYWNSWEPSWQCIFVTMFKMVSSITPTPTNTWKSRVSFLLLVEGSGIGQMGQSTYLGEQNHMHSKGSETTCMHGKAKSSTYVGEWNRLHTLGKDFLQTQGSEPVIGRTLGSKLVKDRTFGRRGRAEYQRPHVFFFFCLKVYFPHILCEW